jgi:hypothetical protein
MLRTNSCCTSNGRLVEMPLGYTSWVSSPLRLDEDLMRGLVRKAMHLVLDRGTVARAGALDAPVNIGERSNAARMIACVRSLVCGDVAGDLFGMLARATKE